MCVCSWFLFKLSKTPLFVFPSLLLTPKQTKVLEQSRLGQRLRAYLNNANNAEELQALCGSTPKTIIEFAHKLQNMTLTTMHTVPLDVTLH